MFDAVRGKIFVPISLSKRVKIPSFKTAPKLFFETGAEQRTFGMKTYNLNILIR